MDNERGDFLREVLAGLSATPKTLPCKYFYDQRGSELFDRICELDEYYLTRADLDATKSNIEPIVATIGRRVRLVELGSGSSVKTCVLLDHLPDVVAYVPVDLAADALASSVARLRARYPALEIQPVVADYTRATELPSARARPRSTVLYFPGSTIGNLHPPDVVVFLRMLGGMFRAGVAGEQDGGALIGVDLKKDRSVLERAYDDSLGVTAEFNLNLLRRINRELEADFDLRAWSHHARYDDKLGRIEMHLVSGAEQVVTVAGRKFRMAEGERIRTEESYKYSLADFRGLANEAGLQVAAVWTDREGRFSLQWLVPA